MTIRSKYHPLLPLLLILPMMAGCLFDPPKKDPIGPVLPDYLPYFNADPTTAMNNLVANFVTAWERMDLAEYRDSILYNGTEAAPDGELYQVFIFTYDRSLDPDLPEFDLYDREIQRVTNMFGGLPGHGVPGFRSISLDLTANGVWSANLSGTGEVQDPYPAGTMWRAYESNMLITLKSNIGDTDINQWLVEDRLVLHLIPIRVENANAPGTYHTRYKIWKWRDVIT